MMFINQKWSNIDPVFRKHRRVIPEGDIFTSIIGTIPGQPARGT